MTEDQAKAECAKRNLHKGKALATKKWAPVPKEDGSFGLALVDTVEVRVARARKVQADALADARRAFFGGGTVGEFKDAAERMLLARCEEAIASYEGD